jgi:virginiamycin B lyase
MMTLFGDAKLQRRFRMSLNRLALLLGAFLAMASAAAGQAFPNPYIEIGSNWARLPQGTTWGVLYTPQVDSHGNVWVLDRCGQGSCVDTDDPAILEFDSSGRFIKGIGQGLFAFPHNLFIDKDDFLWVADAGVGKGKGNQVTKLSPDGKVLMTLGTKGVMGGGPENFVGVSAVLVGPNGDIFVADGHSAVATGGGNSRGFKAGADNSSHMRIVKYSKDGKFIKAWGKLGTGPGEFNTPHGLALDSQGRLFVADRGNNRVQIFDQDGKFLEEWTQFGKACSVHIDKNDTIYVIDSDSIENLWTWKYSAIGSPCSTCLVQVPRITDVGRENSTFTQGIRIGRAKDGVVTGYIPPHMGPQGPTTIPEFLTTDANGNLYVAEGRNRELRKYVKKPELPEGPGKELVQKACEMCHDSRELYRVNFDRQDWDAAVHTMVGGGAPLNTEEIKVVVDYLANNFKGVATPGVAVAGSVQTTISEWDVPTPNSMPYGIYHSKPNGYTWYTGTFSNEIGRFDPKTQEFHEYHLRPGTNPSSLFEFHEGNYSGVVFFAPQTGNILGEFHPIDGPYPTWSQGDVIEHPIPGPTFQLHDTVMAPNAVIWFTGTEAKPPLYPEGSKIGRYEVSSQEVRLVDTPTPNAGPYNIAVNSRSVPFFTERNSPALGSLNSVTMQVTEYPLPNPDSGPRGITITPDDTVWYTDYSRGYLGRFDPKTGKFDEWPSPSGSRSLPYGITNVGDVIWYAEAGSTPNMLVRFDPKTQKFQSWPVKAGGGIRSIYADVDGSLWFTRPLTNGIAHVTIQDK